MKSEIGISAKHIEMLNELYSPLNEEEKCQVMGILLEKAIEALYNTSKSMIEKVADELIMGTGTGEKPNGFLDHDG